MDLHGLLKLIVRDVAGKLGASLGEPSDSTKDARACAIADIVALAALADGQVTREELKVLQRTTVGEDEQAVVASERLYRIDASAEDLRSPAWLAVKVGDLALALDRAERRETLRLVAHLAEHGARLEKRELPDGRVAGLTARELVELFASALAVPSGEIDGVLREPSTLT
ncbi:MAG: hypothetical protein J0L92_35740 [Deltaproteobacteria bacterium]|nr:hypothetical protein [Deltaproteobacteria bacterium]